MKAQLIILIALSVLATKAFATTRLPTFKDYPAIETFTGLSAKLNSSSHPYARRFRTVLSGELEQGPNFAGRYVLASWGCGSSCEAMAIIDAKTGRVWVPEEIESITHNFPCTKPLVEFDLKSALLKITDRDGSDAVTRYLMWREGKLRMLLKTRKTINAFCGSTT